MDLSEKHLESALAEYDGRISSLKSMGASLEYLEALVNRSSILIMLESYDEAVNDLYTAMKVEDKLSQCGEDVNVGTYVKLYENHGLIMYDRDPDIMRSDYAKIVPKLSLMNENVRHYDRVGQISMCIDCAMDLLDFKYYDDCIPFFQRGEELLGDDNDVWARNRAANLFDMKGQVYVGKEDDDKAIDNFTKSIEIGRRLHQSSGNDDPVSLANTLIRRGDAYCRKGMLDEMYNDQYEAAEILENLYELKKFTDTEILSALHKEIASYLLNNGNIEKAEKHLIKSMKFEIPEMKDTIKKMKDYK